MTISATAQGLRPGVCTSTSRPSTPFDGQVIYETDTDKALVWNGTAWVALSTGRTNHPGLDLVKSETSFSAVSSVTIPNSTFTSTYKFYRMNVQFTASSGGANFTFQVRSNGTTATASYYAATSRLLFNNTTSNLFSNNAASATVITVSSAGGNHVVFELANGFGSTGYAQWFATGTNDNQAGMVSHGGQHQVSQNNDAAVFGVSAGNITGTYTIYGYAS